MTDLAGLAATYRRAATVFGDEGVRRLASTAGWAVKREVLRAGVRAVGGDRRMSRFGSPRSRGKVRLSARYAEPAGNTVVLEMRPAGMWAILEDGARAHKVGAGRRTARGRYTRQRGGRPLLAFDGGVITGPVDHPGARPRRTLTKGVKAGAELVPRWTAEELDRLLAELLD